MSVERIEVGAGLDGVPTARRFTREVLHRWNRQAVAEAAEVAVTELVTNALLHAVPPVALVVEDLPGEEGVALHVHDRSQGLPVRLRSNLESMTGRGLGLVNALAARWGTELTDTGKAVWAHITPTSAQSASPEVDMEVLLAAFDDDLVDAAHAEETRPDATEPPVRQPVGHRYTITLGDVPTDLLLAAKSHVDELVRELTLSASGAATGVSSALPPHLGELVHTVVTEFSEAREAIKRQAVLAAGRGEDRTTLTLTLPAEAAEAGERYLAGLEEADRYARGARLLTLAAPPQHQVFRRWYVTSLVAALRQAAAGEPPTAAPTFEAYLLDAVDRLAELQQVSQRAARLQRVTAALAEPLGQDQVAETALAAAVAELAAARGSVLLPKEDGDGLRLGAQVNMAPRLVDALRTAVRDGRRLPTTEAYHSGRAMWIESRDELLHQFPALCDVEPDVVSMCAVPLRVAEHVVGALRLSFTASRLFTEDERAFVVALAAAAAQALERARLYESWSQVADRLTRLQAVTAALARARGVNEVLDTTIEHATVLVGATAASLSTLDDDAHTIRTVRVQPPVASRGRDWSIYDLSDPVPAAEAIRTGEPVWAESVAERDERSPALAAVRLDFEHTLVVLPLHAEDRTIGALTLSFKVGERQQERAFLTAFADACAHALVRAWAAERADLSQRRLAFLARASEQLADTLDIERTLRNVARLAVPQIADWSVVHLLHDGELHALAVEHVDPQKLALALEVQRRWPERVADPTGVGAVVRTGVPLHVPDIPAAVTAAGGIPGDPERAAALRQLGLGSVIIVPLIARGRTLGALTFIAAESGRRYDETDLSLAQDLARRAAVAIDNARLFESLGARNTTVAFRAGDATASDAPAQSDQLARLLETMNDAYFRLDTSWRFTYVNSEAERLFYRRREELVGHYIWDEFPEGIGGPYQHNYEFAIATGQQVTFEEFFVPLGRWFEVRATPEPDGLSVFFHEVDERRAAQQGRAQADARLELVVTATRRFAALLEPVEVLDQLADLLVPHLGSFAATGLRAELAAQLRGEPARGRPGDVEVVHVRPGDRAVEEQLSASVGSSQPSAGDPYGFAAVVATGLPQETAEITNGGGLGRGPAYTVPLISRRKTLGAVTVVPPQGGRLDRALIADLATRAAVALDNALLYAAERRTGLELQRNLLPRDLPRPGGIETAVRYLPSTHGALTGGDFYESIEVNGSLVLALGDVAGHGMRSAARMGQLRAIVAALALQGLHPGELLQRIGADIDRLLDLDLATLVVCRYDLGSCQLAAASAGHPPPLLMPPDAPPRYLPLDPGPPLGAGSGDYPEAVVSVPSGTTLLLFSDGLVENRGESLSVGLERLRRALVGVRLAPEAVADHVLAETGRLHGGPDDVALLVLRRA